MNRLNSFIIVTTLLFATIMYVCSCKNSTNDMIPKNNVEGTKCRKQIDKSINNRRKRKYIEYKKITPWNYRDTIPYDNCYIIIEKDSLFYYYKEGKLEEVRRMIIDSFYRYKTFHFKEKSDDILQFSHSNDTVHLLRDSYDGKTEYFIFDKEYDEACQ